MNELVITNENKHLISGDQANHYKILPKESTNDTITLFIDEGLNTEETKEVAQK